MSNKEDNSQRRESSISVSITYGELYRSQEVHKYSLRITIGLRVPPAKDGFLLKLYWPVIVPATTGTGLTEKDSSKREGIRYVEFSRQYTDKLYPGDSLEILPRNQETSLEYQFDHEVWDKVEHETIWLYWEMYFDDQMPVKGKVNFKELNKF